MTKRFVTFPLFLLAALILTVSASADAESGQMEIANRSDADGAFSCDVNLSGGQIHGSVFAALFAESGRMKCASGYPAVETVQVALPDVAETDYIKIMWLDEQCAPLAHPAMLRMSGNGSSAYEKFAEDFLKLQEKYGGNGGGAASGSDDPYVLARLLVSCAELPDLSGYNVVAMLSGPDNLYVLQFNTAGEAKECAEYLRTFPSVRYAEPDSVMQADSAELSSVDSVSWGAEATGIAAYAENLRQRGVNNSIIVAAVDSGADLEHPFLKGRLVSGYDFIDKDNAPQDSYGHGTHVAGIIADCTPGTDVKIMPVRVLDSYGTGSASYIGAGVRYAADHGANVINLSLGLKLGHSSYVEEAIAYAISKNITVVVAAGNQNSDVKERCPAHMEECVTVAAADRNWKRFELSNYGENVDIAAPGVAINSSLPGGKYGEMSGTSMAAPHVSAAAALLMEERGAAQTPAQISRALRDSAASLDVSGQMAFQESVRFGAGFLNLTPFIIHPQRTIAFYANDGTGDMTPQSAASGSLIALKSNAFSRDGYQFAGWNTKADGSGDAYPDGATLTVTQNLSLYAQWEEGSVLYALLYADGEIVFQNSDKPNPGKALEQVYKIPATGATGEYAKWHDRRADIQTATFAEPVRPSSTALWFYSCENLTEVRGVENLDASAVTDMSQMFAYCTSLKTLDLNALDTGNVTNMRQMFFQCAALTTIYDSDAFSVSKVTESTDMFTGCTSLVGGSGTEYDAAHTDKTYARIDGGASSPGYFTDKNTPSPSNDIYAVLYTDGELVFQNNDRTDSGRVVTDIYKVDKNYYWTENGETTTPWYGERKNITTVTFADKIQPDSTAWWLSFCENLIEIRNIENLDTFHVVNMSGMFYKCRSLVALDVSGFYTSNVTDMSWMFDSCGSLRTLDASGFDTSNVIHMGGMFQGCNGLTSLDVSRFNTANVTDMRFMFFNCANLKTIYASDKFTTASVPETEYHNSRNMFSDCMSLVGGAGTKYDGNHIDKEYARIDGGASAPGYFTDKNAPQLSNDVYAVLYADGEFVFQHDKTPESGKNVLYAYNVDLNAHYRGDLLNYAPWYEQRNLIRTVTFADEMWPVSTAYWFYECGNLLEVRNIKNLHTANVTYMFNMFDHCRSLTALDLSSFDTANVTAMNFMFCGCYSLTALDLSNFDTSNVMSMYSMFCDCHSLMELDLSSFDTVNVTAMGYMFSGCFRLQTIYVSDKFTTVSTPETEVLGIFYRCDSLVGGSGTTYDGHTGKEYVRIDGGASAPGYFTRKS